MPDWYNHPVMEPIRLFVDRVLEFLPNVLLMLAVLIFGAIFARLVRAFLRRFLRFAGFNTFSQRSGLGEVLTKGGVRLSPSDLVAKIVYYLLALVFFFMALSALNLKATTDLISNFFGYLPNILLALAILAVSYLLARFLHRSALIGLVNASVPRASLVARSVQAGILILGFAVALEHLSIGRTVVLAAFSITFGGIVLALALSFGLAGKDIARDVLEKQLRDGKAKQEPPDEMHHL